MADIDVSVGSEPGAQEQAGEQEAAEETPSAKFNLKLKARRTLDGNIIVSDHPNIDIIILPEKMKVLTFPKNSYDDEVYDTQNRFFKYLFKKGVMVHDSVVGGNVYGAVEAKIQKPKQEFPIDDVMLMIVGKFIEQEKPSYVYQKSLEQEYIDDMTEPDEEHSTELGKVPAAQEKGSVPIHQVRRYAYGL